MTALLVVRAFTRRDQSNGRVRSTGELVDKTAIIEGSTYHHLLVYGDCIYDCTLTFIGSMKVSGNHMNRRQIMDPQAVAF